MTKRIFLLAVTLLLISPSAFAQANEFRRYEIGLGTSVARLEGDYFGGGDMSFAFHISPRLAIAADVTGYLTAESPLGGHQELTFYGFGPRFTTKRGNRWMFFGQALAGGARLSETFRTSSGPTTTTITTAINGSSVSAGAGVDIGLKNWIALRLGEVHYTLAHFSDVDENIDGIKVGFGVVFRFGKK
jgi:hypothetical protein